MSLREYKRARTLATIEHAGLTFRIVRWRDHDKGRPWRKYLALLYGDLEIANLRETDPLRGATKWKALFNKPRRDPRLDQ